MVMPTATSSMHTDPSLSEASMRTAERGKTILKTLMGSELARKNCRAIYQASLVQEPDETDDSVDEELVEVRR